MARLWHLQIYNKDASGYRSIFGTPFRFHHAASFAVTYKEFFFDEIYKFNPAISEIGVILDCGANIRLSVLYFFLNYPNHQIVAFEPAPAIFEILEENILDFNLSNVILHRKAVWTEKTELTFYFDGVMGGCVDHIFETTEQIITKVSEFPLSDWASENVDFLKIDLEGNKTNYYLHLE